MISKQEREHHLSTFEADAGHCDRRFICTFPQSTVYTDLLDTANFFGFVTHSVAICLQINIKCKQYLEFHQAYSGLLMLILQEFSIQGVDHL